MSALAWGAKVSPEFREKVRSIAARIGTEPSSLMACIAFETGRTFSPKARNPGSSATGLIQFMANTAKSSPTRSFNYVQWMEIPMNPLRTEEIRYPPIPLTILDNKP